MLDEFRANEISGMDFMANESIIHHADSLMELQIAGLLIFRYLDSESNGRVMSPTEHGIFLALLI
jgi:hypothetical protein